MKLELLEMVRDRIANSRELSQVCGLDSEVKRSIARRAVEHVEEMILEECGETDKFEVHRAPQLLDEGMTDNIGQRFR